MPVSLADRIGIGDHELVSIVGAGGKSTILFQLGRDLAEAGARVVLTTTTMLAEDQVTEPVCWSGLPSEVDALVSPGVPLFVVSGRVPGKMTGPSTTAVDRIFSETSVDFLLTEADGARHMLIKAPAEHEPVIPEASTIVIVVASIDAIGRPISEVAFRPDLVAGIAGVGVDDSLTIGHAAAVLLHPNGGLKSISDSARVVMALTKATRARDHISRQLAAILECHPSVDRVITLGEQPVID